MNNDLKKLYRAREIVAKNDSVSRYNDSLLEAAANHTRPIRQASDKAVKRLESKCSTLATAHRLSTRLLPVLAVMVAVIAAYVLLTKTVLSETLFLDFDTFVDKARAYATANAEKFPTLLMGGNLKRDSVAERIAYFNSDIFAIDCYTFLAGSVMWMTAGGALVCAMIDKDELSGFVFAFDILLFLGMVVTLLIKVKDILGVVIGVLWMSITGIPMMWVCGWPLILSFLVVNAVVITALTMYNVMAKKHRTKVAPKLAGIVEWKAQIAAEKADCKTKCAKIDKAYSAKMKAYPAEYASLEPFLRDYGYVSQLIWVIENSFARDLVGARNYLEQKARDAALRKQLAAVQRDAQAALQAARDAEAAARAAEAAAREPVEVNVTIW